MATIEELNMAQAALLSSVTAKEVRLAFRLHWSLGFQNLIALLFGKSPEELKG